MKWFRGLEGARGWLAWAVVVSHLVYFTGLFGHIPALSALLTLGDVAVQVFIILSGFVIFHLIIEKPEPYGAYLTRRFMRIFPIYVVCLFIGVGTTFLMFDLVRNVPWSPDLTLGPHLFEDMQSIGGSGIYTHILLHLTMLHGAVPNNLLFDSQFLFLPPAWSLSLEWQFYLVAPICAALIAVPRMRVGLALATAVGAFLFHEGYFGEFVLPSLLPGAALLFAAGIISRLALPKLIGRFELSASAIVIVAAFILIGHQSQSHLAIWAVLMAYIVAQGTAEDEAPGFRRGLAAALDSRPAIWLGRRSYCTYLIHVPVIQAAIYAAGRLGLSYPQMIAWVFVAAPAATLLASDILHRSVETPGIELGRRFVRRFFPDPSAAPADQAAGGALASRA